MLIRRVLRTRYAAPIGIADTPGDLAGLVSPLTEYLAETQRLRSALNEIKGVTVQETQTNFMLARLEKGTAAEMKEFLIQHYGILIRDASNFTGLTAAHFRVATQTREENDRLIEAVKAYVYR